MALRGKLERIELDWLAKRVNWLRKIPLELAEARLKTVLKGFSASSLSLPPSLRAQVSQHTMVKGSKESSLGVDRNDQSLFEEKLQAVRPLEKNEKQINSNNIFVDFLFKFLFWQSI